MSVLRMLAIVMVTDRITATSRMRLSGWDRRDDSRWVSFATTMPTQRLKTADHRIDGSGIASASDDQPFGEPDHRPRTESRSPRRSRENRVAATSATAGHASGHIALHAIVVRVMRQRGLLYSSVVVAPAATVLGLRHGSILSLRARVQ